MLEELKRLPYWDKLTESEKQLLERSTVIRQYAGGTFLKGCSEFCMGMIYVLSGSVRALIISDEGRALTLFKLNPGDSCVLSASCVLSRITLETQLVTIGPARIMVVDIDAFASIVESNIQVKNFSLELAAERMASAINVLQEIITCSFERRLAGFLLAGFTADVTRLEITREEIARDVNSAREVVSRTLKQFEARGIIALDKHAITLIDREKLKQLT